MGSERLHIHTNTLRYRLTKIEQTAGINLADPGIRLVLASSSRHSTPPDPLVPCDLALDLGERCPLGEKRP
ncbi:helix-turn-helix domain-containing protein [Streptomyces mirabilis]